MSSPEYPLSSSPLTSFYNWKATLPEHLQKAVSDQDRIARLSYADGFKNGLIEGKSTPRSREKYRLSSYTESILKVHGERDRLAAENRDLTKALDEAVTSNKRMHKIVDTIEDLLTTTEG